MNLTSLQKMIVNTANEIVKHDLAPKAADIDCEHRFPREGMQKLAEMEFVALTVPEELGGVEGDTLTFVLAAEGVSRGCPSTALVYVTHSVTARSIVLGGSDELKQNLLPDMVSGKKLGAVAFTEPNSGSNPFAVQTRGKRDGSEYVINGSKTFITGTNEADLFLVLLRTGSAADPTDITGLIIEKDTPGFAFGKVEHMMGLRGSAEGELFFDDCRVPASNLIGTENEFIRIMPKLWDLSYVGAAAIALGIAQNAFDDSVRHAKTREISGNAIGDYQGIQFMLSEMSTQIAAGKSLTYDAAVQMDEPETPFTLAPYHAKLFSTEMAIDVTHRALQIHGGSGYSQDLPLERYYRDARGLTLHFTPSEMLKDMLGKLLLGKKPY